MFLAKSDFSQGRAISLFGFSLGGVVMFNCLKILKKLREFDDFKAG
jgi:surfactin synthase thioesterase subunit